MSKELKCKKCGLVVFSELDLELHTEEECEEHIKDCEESFRGVYHDDY